ncbi:MAG: glutamate-5-semialdehyde dehydrogenase [Gemmatimonadetes bacterium]|nr:glutamate-5-semialdehyde dehydrogenase [Gemmatimonadota bacterium]
MADDIKAAARTARQAALTLSQATKKQRNAALEAIAQALHTNRDHILEANKRDQAAAEKMLAQGEITLPLIKRLKVDDEKLDSEIIVGVRSVAAQEDPIGKTQAATELDEGLNLYRVTVPIGVIGVVFESRPDALVQIATLCLKSGNAVMLKGGSEAFHTNRALAEIMVAATADLDGIPEGWMHLLETREEVAGILELHDLIDLIIPRGGNEFVQHIMNNTKIPVMGHADGICHVYVDKDADLKKAVRIAIDSKTQYAAVCNAAETLLVHAEIARNFFATAIQQLTDQGVLIRGDARTLDLAASADALTPASDSDWSTEYLDYVLSVKVVDSVEEAIAHINEYSSHHTDSIVTEDQQAAKKFLQAVDSASVIHNASTRFADGFRYGLGAEVGISTNRLHSRGPVGLEGLVIYKYVVTGEGHIADDYIGENAKTFTHRKLDVAWRPE